MEREELEKLTMTYQKLQAQLQSLAMQREQFRQQKEEYTEALAELQKATGKVYHAKGGMIVESNKDEAAKDLKEKLDSADLRHTIANKQYEEAAKKEKELRTQITTALKGDAKQ
jgi:prefoldin beta subunit